MNTRLPNRIKHRDHFSLTTPLRSDGFGRLGPVLAHDGHHAQVHELWPLDDVLEGGHEVGGKGLVDEPVTTNLGIG